jgi:hypothetical protein
MYEYTINILLDAFTTTMIEKCLQNEITPFYARHRLWEYFGIESVENSDDPAVARARAQREAAFVILSMHETVLLEAKNALKTGSAGAGTVAADIEEELTGRAREWCGKHA